MRQNKLMFVASAAAITMLLATGSNLFGTPTTLLAQTAQAPLYTSCDQQKLAAPLSAQPSATAAATSQAPAATQAATQTSAAAANEDIVFLSIVGSESQACYVATETFAKGNFMGLPAGFNNPVGITQTIQGDLALDRTNVANSQIGDIKINISEFKSDNPRRDGFIRQNFLESNKYPYATLTNATVLGLPSAAYQDGTTIHFQVQGTLTVHNTARPTTFDATGTFSNNVLVVSAMTDLKMSDFGIQVPNIANLVKADDGVRLIVNLVARPSQSTPAATQ
ncbi:MAG TPA: YceI family protein [Aggregatilineales bacterium]|nr:YceI family protein [Aggregatilineales bacterium]